MAVAISFFFNSRLPFVFPGRYAVYLVGRGLVSRRLKHLKSYETAGVNPRPTAKWHVHGQWEHFIESGFFKSFTGVWGRFLGSVPTYIYFTSNCAFALASINLMRFSWLTRVAEAS